MAKKSVKKKVNDLIKLKREESTGICCEKKWNLVPLRFAIGLMFIAAGLPKLLSLINGGTQISGFFGGLGIPFPGVMAWVVAIAEVVGGVFLLLGFLTWWTGAVLVIIMLVATVLTTLNPMNWGNLTKHLVFIAGLVALMYGPKEFSLKPYWCKMCCRK